MTTAVAAIENVLHSSGIPELDSRKRLRNKFPAAQEKYRLLRQVSATDLESFAVKGMTSNIKDLVRGTIATRLDCSSTLHFHS